MKLGHMLLETIIGTEELRHFPLIQVQTVEQSHKRCLWPLAFPRTKIRLMFDVIPIHSYKPAEYTHYGLETSSTMEYKPPLL